jgi:two-component system, response regulator PdtaR
MLKPRRLDARPSAILQPTPTFRSRLVRAHDIDSGSIVSSNKTARILIVEDDYLISTAMESELTAAGYEVVGVAASASEAVALAIEEKPDLAIMDIGLEGPRDGVEAAIEIFHRCEIRSLFASAYYNPEIRLRAEACSPLGWVPKPYTMAALVEAVRAALRALGHSTRES